jgi:hypothetical protein
MEGVAYPLAEALERQLPVAGLGTLVAHHDP